MAEIVNFIELLNNLDASALGDLDSSFDPGSGIDGPVFDIKFQPDGKILVCGQFTTVRGLVRRNVARLNPDGTGDATFEAGLVSDYSVDVVEVLPDGKILIAGAFATVHNITRLGVARLGVNGTVDLSFNPGTVNVGGIIRYYLGCGAAGW